MPNHHLINGLETGKDGLFSQIKDFSAVSERNNLWESESTCLVVYCYSRVVVSKFTFSEFRKFYLVFSSCSMYFYLYYSGCDLWVFLLRQRSNNTQPYKQRDESLRHVNQQIISRRKKRILFRIVFQNSIKHPHKRTTIHIILNYPRGWYNTSLTRSVTRWGFRLISGLFQNVICVLLFLFR